ncbi:MAG TPA: DUF6572 domain-containing protein [Gaiellales bacterium]|nr:DUF6572 domain-containing protein [Gaiellales bacterium]
MDADVVDLVSLSPDGTTYALSIIETRPWTDSDEQLYDVQAKLYAYLDYIESGHLAEDYPDAVDKKKMIILRCVGDPLQRPRSSSGL